MSTDVLMGSGRLIVPNEPDVLVTYKITLGRRPDDIVAAALTMDDATGHRLIGRLEITLVIEDGRQLHGHIGAAFASPWPFLRRGKLE